MNESREVKAGRQKPSTNSAKFVACSAPLSTISFPAIPQWPGWDESRSEIAEREACESYMIRYSQGTIGEW